ncbi:MAG: hypothetical protein ACO3EZ_04070 [Prochlorotrichaceae cyanobacterium]
MFDVLMPLSHSLSASVDTIALVLHPASHALSHIAQEGMILAQSTDADLVAEFQKAFKHFVDSGQVWAMLIGVIIGYVFRSFTTYG